MSADARPVLLVTNLVAPDRAGAFQALHRPREHRARALRRPLPPRHRGRRRPRRPAPRRQPARDLRPGRLGPLPRGDRRDRRTHRAARGVGRRPPRARPLPAVDRALGPPAHRRLHRRRHAAAAHALPPRRRDHHLRVARQRVRRPARRAQRPRRAPGGRRRVLVAGRRPGASARHPPRRRGLRRAQRRPRRALQGHPRAGGRVAPVRARTTGGGAHARRGNGEPRRPTAARVPPRRPPGSDRRCATSTPARTSW